jgi:hypothetical protein
MYNYMRRQFNHIYFRKVIPLSFSFLQALQAYVEINEEICLPVADSIVFVRGSVSYKSINVKQFYRSYIYIFFRVEAVGYNIITIRTLCGIAPCCVIGVDRRFRRAYFLHHKGE